MSTDVNPLQPLKALLSIDVTELGMVTDVNPLQPLKTPVGIIFTLLPIIKLRTFDGNLDSLKRPVKFSALKEIVVSSSQPKKALLLISLTSFCISNVFTSEGTKYNFVLLALKIAPFSTYILSLVGYEIDIPFLKGLLKLLGYADFLSPVHSSKASLPIELTKIGMMTDVKPRQP